MKKITILTLLILNFYCFGMAQHFTSIGTTGYDFMNIYIYGATINGINMEAGDEIGIFDGSNCVGAGVLTGVPNGGSPFEIRPVADDPTTGPVDGFITGHTASIRIWDASSGLEITNTSSSSAVVLIAGTTSWITVSGTFTPPIPTAPIVGLITQPTCTVSTGSVELSGLPATGSWILTMTPGGITTNGTGTTITISGLAAETTYTFTVTDALGGISNASIGVVINAQPSTPLAPTVGAITQPTCAVATGSVVLSGLPAGNWTINPGAIAGTGASTTISGLAARYTYNFTVTNAAGCTSPASANVVINAQPATPTAPTVGTITQPTCAVATGSVVLSGLPAGNWTINPGAIAGNRCKYNYIRLAAGHIQLYSYQCSRMYFTGICQCGYQCSTGSTSSTDCRNHHPAYLCRCNRKRGIKRFTCR